MWRRFSVELQPCYICCCNSVFRMPFPPDPTSTWWDWSWWLRAEEWTVWSCPSKGIWIHITLNLIGTKDPEEHNLVLKRQDTHFLSTFLYKLWCHARHLKGLQNCLAAWTCINMPFLHSPLHRLELQKLLLGTFACARSEKGNLFSSPEISPLDWRVIDWVDSQCTHDVITISEGAPNNNHW